MTIFKGSRYEYSVIDFLSTTTDGSANPVVQYQFTNGGYMAYYEHVYVEGERLDEIAFKYYQLPGFWWSFMESNPEIADINNIPAGTVLRIPNG
ncbi:Phage Tail Protein X-like [uncultured Caudovirales phage]|uniref:Phage Tail Protein X-like n=1 Tax=uncultured Caudovirales phage TaxID=2100421 RepID=A0A6J5PTW3_9CAUD|nr:Phage Tail Protein X-like [uncultured Caudovirales phage]CAB4179745.1 Phage Tail Protein X-like [uncultured Caudovirales phage]CAB4188861.1 Phage Tail Protein X-like [uncultured Caudovirales phage]